MAGEGEGTEAHGFGRGRVERKNVVAAELGRLAMVDVAARDVIARERERL